MKRYLGKLHLLGCRAILVCSCIAYEEDKKHIISLTLCLCVHFLQ